MSVPIPFPPDRFTGTDMPWSVCQRIKRHMARLAFLPGLWFCRAMNRMRIWRAWHRVDEHLIIGAFPSVRELRELHDLGVRTIINLCEEHPGNVAAISNLYLEQVYIPCLDFHAPSAQQILKAVEAIRREARAKRPAYLHCKAGRLRSAIVAMAWLVCERGMTPAEAAQFLRKTRPQVDARLLIRVDWVPFIRRAAMPHRDISEG